MEGYTETLSSVDTLKLDIFLQKWNGSSWSKTNSDDYSIDFMAYYDVTQSGKYRLKATHKVTDNGVTETKTTTTSSIIIK